MPAFYLILPNDALHLTGFSVGEGAGSGGSIWVTTNEFGGHGEVTANGGNGFVRNTIMSGSGSGGRIAFHVSELHHYRGALKAVGGIGSGTSAGGPGTVFTERKIGYGYLYIYAL